MQRNSTYFILCISFFLVLTMSTQTINAATSLNTFETNPIKYWSVSDEIIASYYDNNTVSVYSAGISTDWYSFNWDKRVVIYLNGSSGAGTDYQIKINVTYDSDMQINFDDIIFTDNDRITLLSFWLEEKVNSEWCIFWVKISDSLETNNYIYMYYDNIAASSLSNGVNTFMFFDDFENNNLNRWSFVGTNWATTGTEQKYGSYSAYGNAANTGVEKYLTYDNSISWNSGFMFHAWFMVATIGATTQTALLRSFEDDTTQVYTIDQNENDLRYYNGTWYFWSEDSLIVSTWYRIEIGLDFIGSTETGYLNNVFMDTIELDNGVGSTITEIDKFSSITDTSNGEDHYIDDFYVRKWIVSEPYYNSSGSEVDSSTINYDEGIIKIRLSNSNDVKIKTMVELNSFSNNEYVDFIINTSLGEINNIQFRLNETYNYRIRLEFELKKSINIYKITIYNEYQLFINRTIATQIISKNITELIIRFGNFTNDSKMTMFYLSGSIDYTQSIAWNVYEDTSSDYDIFSQWLYSIETDGAVTTTSEVYTNVSFYNFQYLRAYMNMHLEYSGVISDGVAGYCQSIFNFEVANYRIGFYIRYDIDGDLVFGACEVEKDGTGVFQIFDIDANDVSVSGTFDFVQNFKIWRTLDSRLGFAVASDNEIWRRFDDDRIDIETEHSYYYSDEPLDNWAGNITITHDWYLDNSAGSTFYSEIAFDEMEYDFSAQYGIAEPHFSSTWFGLFPFNLITGWLIDTFTTDLDLPAGVTEFLDMFTGIGTAVADALAPILGGTIDVLNGVWNTLVEIGSDIVAATGAIFDNIVNAVLGWGQDVINWFIDALMNFVSAIADFLIWFVNGIGSLLGITDLAGIIADIVVNFTMAIVNFLLGIVLIFSVVIDGFAFIAGLITTYLPTALTFAGILIMMHVGLAFASMDDKIIMDMAGVYIKIFSKLLEVFYSVANMLIQFIGGIIP